MRSLLQYLTTALILIGMLGVPMELPGNIPTVTEEADTKPMEENSVVVSQLRITSFRPGKKKNIWVELTADNPHSRTAHSFLITPTSLFLLYRSILI